MAPNRIAAVALATMAYVIAAPAVRADPPWSARAELAGAPAGMHAPAIAFGQDGRALLSATGPWRGTAGISTGFVASHAGGRVSRGAVHVPGLAAEPVVFGRDRVVIVRHTPEIRGASGGRLTAAIARTRDPLRPGQELMRGADLERAAVAATDDGVVAIAWVEMKRRVRHDRLRFVMRRPGQPFGPARTLIGSGKLRVPTLAFGARGDLVVAVQQLRRGEQGELAARIVTRVRRAGHSFGPLTTIGRSKDFVEIVAGVAADGHMIVAWRTEHQGEGVDDPGTVYAAVKPSGPHGFRPVRELDRGLSHTPLSLALGRDGSATLAWSIMSSPTTNLPRVELVDPAGRFLETQNAPIPGAAFDVTTAPDGATLLIVGGPTQLNYLFAGLTAAVRPPGAIMFGPAEVVAPAIEQVFEAQAAFDPVSGRPTVAWLGASQTGSSGNVLRVATRG